MYRISKEHGEFIVTMDGRRYRDVFIILYEYAARLEKALDIHSE